MPSKSHFVAQAVLDGYSNKSKGSSMKATINPAWLVSLMTRWAVRQLRTEEGVLGYPKKSCGFSEKTTGGYSHSDPTAFSAQDFENLDLCLSELSKTNNGQFAAMMMYYKPWVVNAMRAEGWPFGSSTYYHRLHAAHASVASRMDEIKYFGCFVSKETIESIATLE